MSNAASSNTPGNIVFFENLDDPRAGDSLRDALSRVENIPLLGLVVKVREGKEGEQIVNWMFADEATIKSLALILPK